LLTLNRHLDGIHFRAATSVRVEEKRFGGYRHRNGPIHLFEEIVDYGG